MLSRYRLLAPDDIPLNLERTGCVTCVAQLCLVSKERSPMSVGTVKWFNNQKGFGFIQPDNGSKDVFVHISAVERAGVSTLQKGQNISYEVAVDRRTGKSAAESLRAA